MTNKKVNKELKALSNALINDLNNKPLEYIDLLAYNRAKMYLINKKYYGDD